MASLNFKLFIHLHIVIVILHFPWHMCIVHWNLLTPDESCGCPGKTLQPQPQDSEPRALSSFITKDRFAHLGPDVVSAAECAVAACAPVAAAHSICTGHDEHHLNNHLFYPSCRLSFVN